MREDGGEEAHAGGRADGSYEELEGSGTYPLGLSEHERDFRVNERRLAAGERVLLYTDGVTERRYPDGTMLGLEGLASTLRGSAEVPAAIVIRDLQDAVLDASPAPLRDDATTLLLAPDSPTGATVGRRARCS